MADKSVGEMSSKGNSGRPTKRRRKRQSICYKTGREKRKSKVVLPSIGAVRQELINFSPLANSATPARPETDDDDSISKYVKDNKKTQSLLKKKSVKKPSVTQSEKLKSIAETPSEAGHIKNDGKKTNKASARSVLTSSNDSDKHISKKSLSTQNQKDTDGVVSHTKKKSSLTKSVKRYYEPHSIINNLESHASPPKKAKTSQKPGNKFSQNSAKKKDSKVKTRQRKNPVIPDRIKDVCVTKKEFAKWKPITKSTKKFTEEVLKSVTLNVMATSSDKNNSNVVGVLETLKKRILERLPDWKAPLTQGDYWKMESQNRMSEEMFLEKSKEINALDKRIEEEERILEIDSAKVKELTKKIKLLNHELHSLDNEKAHPLIVKTKNSLDLPPLSQEMFDKMEDTVLDQHNEEENLSQTVFQLQKNVAFVELTKWTSKLTNLTERLEQN